MNILHLLNSATGILRGLIWYQKWRRIFTDLSNPLFRKRIYPIQPSLKNLKSNQSDIRPFEKTKIQSNKNPLQFYPIRPLTDGLRIGRIYPLETDWIPTPIQYLLFLLKLNC